jgi:hypothetical protein
VRQPQLHAPQHIQQQSNAFPYLFSGFAQPRIAHCWERSRGLRERFAGVRQQYSCWRRSAHFSPRSTTPPNSALDNASRRIAASISAWLPPATVRSAGLGRRQQTHAQLVASLGTQALDQRQPPAYPALVASQQLRNFTWLNPSSRISAWMIQASSSSSRVRPPARFSP